MCRSANAVFPIGSYVVKSTAIEMTTIGKSERNSSGMGF
jgi:hypothetical protein